MPVLTIFDLGIVRDISLQEGIVSIVITPTYSGCPAMDTISMDIRMRLFEQGIRNVQILTQLSPAWTTDWMSDAGKEKLKAYGIAAPQYPIDALPEEEPPVPCPQCNSTNTQILSQFGSTACKALHQCLDCKEPFDYFKCH